MIRITLTDAQFSALECAGAALPEGDDEFALLMAWDGRGFLEFAPEWADQIWRAVNDFSNSEDDAAEDQTNDGDLRASARGAAKALANLAGKIIRA